MKTQLFFLAAIIAMVCFGCNNDDDIFSYVDDYNAPLTEEKGKTYSGDYFPFIQVNYWKYSGHESVTGEMTMNYQGEKETESLDDSYTCTSTLAVNKPESIKLNSGTYSLYPVRETETVDYQTSYITRYFEKSTDAVYLRAIKMDYGNIIEVKNPVYLKIPLVVGDRWEAQPEIDMGSIMENELDISGDIELDMKCMLYVIGKEAMNWKGNNLETVRLDERAQAKGKINIEEDGIKGSMSFDIQITLYLNYLEGVGLISQKSDLSLSMTGSFSGEGEKLTIDMKMDSEGNYLLSSYYFNGEKSININEGGMKDLKGRFPGLTDNPVFQKKLEKCVEITDIVQKVIM
jgi:hypothetical protein